jgi:hypothetical protein
MGQRAPMQHELTLSINDDLYASLQTEAIARGVPVEQVGRFAVQLFAHYIDELSSPANAVLLHPPDSDEPSSHVLYATTVPLGTAVEMTTDQGAQLPPTYLLALPRSGGPRLRLIR